MKRGKRQRAAKGTLNSLCVFPSQMSQLLRLCGGKSMFVAWHNVFCVLSQAQHCHNKIGSQLLKKERKKKGKTKDAI